MYIITKNTTSKPFVKEIVVKTIVDEYPDLSWLEQFKDSNKPEEQEYYKRDKHRLETYGTQWHMMGIKATATVYLPIGNGSFKIQEIDSGGLWGIESDSSKEYIEEIRDEQIKELKKYLSMLNIPYSDSTAIRDDNT